MTQEDKLLLLKDLCTRLPYGVKVKYRNSILELGYSLYAIDGTIAFEKYPMIYFMDKIDTVKPYLRPMSSMTDEELRELNDKYGSIAYFFIQEPPYYHGLQAQHEDIGSIEISEFSKIYDWLNAHYFDYCGLIEKGLALEAPEEMYKID